MNTGMKDKFYQREFYSIRDFSSFRCNNTFTPWGGRKLINPYVSCSYKDTRGKGLKVQLKNPCDHVFMAYLLINPRI